MEFQNVSLGEFVRMLSARIVQDKPDTELPFKDERVWHFLFYELKKQNLPGRPAFLDGLFFDWDGRYPKSQQLSEFLHALHWNASVSAGNPRYEGLRLSQETANSWGALADAIDTEEGKAFLATAVGRARQEFYATA